MTFNIGNKVLIRKNIATRGIKATIISVQQDVFGSHVLNKYKVMYDSYQRLSGCAFFWQEDMILI